MRRNILACSHLIHGESVLRVFIACEWGAGRMAGRGDGLHGDYSTLWLSQAADQIKKLYDLFLKVDATQVEVNPLGETPEGQGTCVCVRVCVRVRVRACDKTLFAFE